MRSAFRNRVVLAVLCVLASVVPAAAQTLVQHCVIVTTCRTEKTEIFGIVIDEQTACRSDVVCHYHWT